MSDTLAILERLIGFDTVSARSNLALVDFVEHHLASSGFRVSRLADPTGTKAGLLAQIGPEGRGILLSAHSDVVPVDGQAWQVEPFRLTRKGARLYGRGTTDMKGFLASMLALASRVGRARLREPLKLSISYDEEVGCLGMARMIEALPRVLGPARAAIVGEPTGMAVAIGHKGKVALAAVARGQAGHSALAPRFTNALHVAADFMSGLRDLQAWYAEHGAQDTDQDIPYTTFHVGRMSGGEALNIVPDRAELLFEFRHVAADDSAEIMARIEALAPRGLTMKRLGAYPGLDTDPNSDVVQLGCALAANDALTKVAFGTEAGFFDRIGIPTVVCGPGSMAGQGHKPDEFITTDQLALCDAMMDRVLGQLTRGEAAGR